MQNSHDVSLAKIQEGKVYEGTIKALKVYGAVVDIGGVNGLLPTSEIGLKQAQDPRNILKIEQKVKVRVHRVDKEQKLVSLGLSQLLENPWDKVAEMYPIGSIHKGTVTRIEGIGCFVDLQNGFLGFVHRSRMDWLDSKPETSSIVSVGDRIKVKVLSFDNKQMHIKLGMKELTENPWDKVDEMYPTGSIHEGRVSRLERFGCFVDLDKGFRGIVYDSQMDWLNPRPKLSSIVTAGEKIKVKVLSVDQEQMQIKLGMKQLTEYPWGKVDKMCPTDSIHTGTVSGVEVFGCFVNLGNGIGGFVHRSKMDWLDPKSNTASLVSLGDKVKVKVIGFDKELMQIQLDLLQLINNLWDKVDEMCPIGSIHESTVSAIQNFGCFVALENGFNGLVHHTQMDWLNPKPDPRRIVSEGEKIKVKVLRVDKEQMHLDLGIKQLKENPWEKVGEMCSVGSIHKGTVSWLEEYGCFVYLENGLGGLVHRSEMDWLNHRPEITSIVSVGDEIKVKVLSFEKEQMRISLGMKQLTEYPLDKVNEMCPIGSIQEGTVTVIQDYGCFVDLDSGIEALLHQSEMDWLISRPDPASIVSEGDKIKVKVLSFDKEKRLVLLGIRQLAENPWDKVGELCPIGSIHEATVSKAENYGYFVYLDNGFPGLVHRSQIDWLNSKPVISSIVSEGDKIKVKVLNFDKEQMHITLGMKQLTDYPWEKMAEMCPIGSIHKGVVARVEGLCCYVDLDNGIEGLIHDSQKDWLNPKPDPTSIVSLGDKVKVEVLVSDKDKMHISLGIRQLIEKPWEKVEEMCPIGSICEATVSKVESFGCFVELENDFRGFVHSTQMDWSNPKPDATSIVSVGDKIKVKVLRFDKEQMLVSLGMKQVKEDPWENVGEMCPIGSIHEGTVVKVEVFGCFVDMQNGFRGFVHSSQMDWFNHKPDATGIVSVGDKVKTKVLSYYEEKMLVTLGMKQLTENPWKKVDEICPIDSIHEGTVFNIQDFGCFVELENGFVGLVYGSEMDWIKSKGESQSKVSVGEKLKVKVLSVDKEKMRISLGLKQLKDNPWERVGEMCPIGSIQEGTVTVILDYGCFVRLQNGFRGLVHDSNMDWLDPRPETSSIVSVGEKVKVQVLSIDKEKKRISFGLKQLTENPWDRLDEFFTIDSIHEGTVSGVEHFGCFVDFENGFRGLVHRSQMDWFDLKPVTTDIVSVGDKIKVKVLSLDKEQMQLLLGMKQLTENPWELLANEYKPGDKLSCKVKSVTDFGIFVELEQGMVGLARVEDISWNQSEVETIKDYSIGDIIEVMIIQIDVARQRIRFGIK